MPGLLRATLPQAFQTWKEALTPGADLALVAYCPLQKKRIILSCMLQLPLADFTKVTFGSALLCPNSGESMPFSYGCFWNLEDTGAVETQREEWIVFKSKVLCVELDVWLFVYVFVLMKREHTELHSGHQERNHYSSPERPFTSGVPHNKWLPFSSGEFLNLSCVPKSPRPVQQNSKQQLVE